MKSIYKIYRDRLVQISGKSRSLYSNTISKKQAYNLGKLFDTDNSAAEDFLDYLWGNQTRKYKLFSPELTKIFIKNSYEQRLKYSAEDIIANEEKSIKHLMREVEDLKKETGRYELYIGYPFVEGIIGKDILIKAPLLLFPVRIHDENQIELELLKEEPVILNKVLALACAKELKLNIDELIQEYDDFSNQFSKLSDLINYVNKFDFALKFSNHKKLITNIEKNDTKLSHGLEVKNYCVLGRYSLANSIYYDYNILDKKKLTTPAVDALLKNKEVKSKDKKQQNYYPIQQLDYAQEETIIKMAKHNNMVIYGPPGTGKSQTIVNIISDKICKDKNVLVVSQKKAALDVVYNRLTHLNSKVALLPDPEKSKQEFYTKIRLRHNEMLNYKPVFNSEKLTRIEDELSKDIAELETISKALFTVTPFGLTLQNMYALSNNFGKNSIDYKLYQAMLNSKLIKMNYLQLNEATKNIDEKNKGKLFYDHLIMKEKNPLLSFIKVNIDLHQINKVRSFIDQIVSKEHTPFNISDYQYSRYLLAYNLDEARNDSLDALVDMIARNNFSSLYNKVRLTGFFPLFWPAYPVYKYKYISVKKEIYKKLVAAQSAVTHYVNEFELLKSVLEPDGLAMVIDSVTYGNDKFLLKLTAALDNYILVRDMRTTLESLTSTEKDILDFVLKNTNNKADFIVALSKILPIRIYHEVISEERKKEAELSKMIIFDDLRKRIMLLKEQQHKLHFDLAMDKFSYEYKEQVEADPAFTKNYLHQIFKQNKSWPIRRLMEHFKDYLLKLFPCWLLSPEAVSAILPLEPGLFDTVIFDEASQIFIESSIPAVYRAQNVVVAGDNMQLRPSAVFIKRYMGDDSYSADLELDEQTLIEVESLLDLATSRLYPTHLTYHYRSRFEELINFSNYAFYEGRLQIAPNVSKNENYLPIERIKVDGCWTDRANVEEARAVVNLIKKLLKNRKNKETIGIVTFNIEQQELIEDLLDLECQKNATFRRLYMEEKYRTENGENVSLFIKNLENVQGDERDIIIFSVAYAKNEAGKLNAQFGVLGLAGGENRLNVAITRAKQKIYVVTSIEPEEFTTIDNSKNKGPKLLVKYLQYARAVSARDKRQAQRILDSLLIIKKPINADIGKFEEELKKELEKLGYTVESNLGSTNYKLSLGIYDKELNNYVLGLECDYTAYAASDSAMERDVYRIHFMESRGWNIMRIWSRDWWMNKGILIKSIEKEIERSRKALQRRISVT